MRSLAFLLVLTAFSAACSSGAAPLRDTGIRDTGIDTFRPDTGVFFPDSGDASFPDARQANTSCAAPALLTPGSPLPRESNEAATDSMTACRQTYRMVYYRATIPAGQTLRVRVTSSTRGFEPILHIMDRCAPTSCLASVAAGAMQTQVETTYQNSTTTSQSVIVAVGSPTAGQAGFFAVDTTTEAPSTINSACSSARTLVDGSRLVFEDVMGAAPFATPPCLPDAMGRVLYYSAAVPPGSALDLVVTPRSGFDTAVRVLDFCDAFSCRAQSDSGGPDRPEYIGYENTDTSTRNLVIAVGGVNFGEDIKFELYSTIGPRQYRVDPISASCDDMAGGTDMPITISDDEVSTIEALPFSIRYFGTMLSYYSVSSNGFLQLHPASTGTPEPAYTNVPLPSANNPNGVIAPFWDDLLPSSHAEAIPTIRYRNVGGTSGRHVVEWADFGTFEAPSARLRFQAKLFASNVIEFHYCQLDGGGGDSHRGSDATVGIESLDAARGVTVLFNTRNGLTEGSGYRLTPR